MAPSLRTRKPVRSLTLLDLHTFPIWQYIDEEESEGEDETWVCPVNVRAVPEKSYTIVAADFHAACGREYSGSITVSRLEEPAEIFQGVIHQADRADLVPNPELAFFDQALAALLEGLGLSKVELFPIRYTLRVPFEGESECRRGVLDGRKDEGSQSELPDSGQLTFW